MISILAIVGLVFALLCVAAWYNQPEPEWEHTFYFGIDWGVPGSDVTKVQRVFAPPLIETGQLKPSLTWHHAYVSLDSLGKAARDASVKVVEFKEAKEALEEEVNDGQ